MNDQLEPGWKRSVSAVPRWLLNHPVRSMTIEVLVVVLHAVATVVLLPSPFGRLAGNEDGARVLFLGIASAGAPLAGFAGVIVIFALGDRQQFRVFRERGGRRLEVTWLALFVFPFTAVFVGLVAAAVTALGGLTWAPFMVELSLVLLLDTLLRGGWLMKNLIGIVTANDEHEKYENNRWSMAEIGMSSH